MTNQTTPLQTTSGQMYLDKDFSVELNFKLWTTKGARFVASQRLKTKSKLSSYCMGFLSSYMIIIGLLSVFKFEKFLWITDQQLAFSTTAISVIMLVFSQAESASEYGLKSEKFHSCALEISELYNKLRYLKTNQATEADINRLSQELSIDYGNILKRYENHESIDFDFFKTSKPDYFRLSDWKVFKIQFFYYYKTKLLYHILIVVPPVIVFLML